MFRNTRVLHRWIGVVTSLFMILMAGTGLLLAVKKKFDWIQPPTNKGAKFEQFSDVAPISKIADAVFAVGIKEMQTMEQIDRFELHLSKRIFKVTSTEGYHEVQVDATTAEVLSVARRNDMLMEQIHDMSFFAPWMHAWVLPMVAVSLLTLGVTGIVIFFVPIFRRWQFKRRGGTVKAAKGAA